MFLPCILFDVPITGTLYQSLSPFPQTMPPNCQNAPTPIAVRCCTGDNAYWCKALSCCWKLAFLWQKQPPCRRLFQRKLVKCICKLSMQTNKRLYTDKYKNHIYNENLYNRSFLIPDCQPALYILIDNFFTIIIYWIQARNIYIYTIYGIWTSLNYAELTNIILIGVKIYVIYSVSIIGMFFKRIFVLFY